MKEHRQSRPDLHERVSYKCYQISGAVMAWGSRHTFKHTSEVRKGMVLEVHYKNGATLPNIGGLGAREKDLWRRAPLFEDP